MAKMYIFVHYIMLCKIICYHIVGMAAILKNGWHWLAVWNIGWLTFYLLTCVIGKGFFSPRKVGFWVTRLPAYTSVWPSKEKNCEKKSWLFNLSSWITFDLDDQRKRDRCHWKEEIFFYKKSWFSSTKGHRLHIGFAVEGKKVPKKSEVSTYKSNNSRPKGCRATRLVSLKRGDNFL